MVGVKRMTTEKRKAGYSDAEARDEHGRWTGGAGGVSASASPKDKEIEARDAAAGSTQRDAEQSRKMSMVHGAQDASSAKLAASRLGASTLSSEHAQAISDLHDNFKNHSYQEITDRVQEIGKKVNAAQAVQMARHIGINRRLGGKNDALNAVVMRIHDRKASFDRISDIGKGGDWWVFRKAGYSDAEARDEHG